MAGQRLRIAVYLGMAGLVFAAYFLSFRKSFNAFVLNRELKEPVLPISQAERSIEQIRRKHKYFSEVLRNYKLDKADAEDALWNKIAGLAAEIDVTISFDPSRKKLTDTSSVKSHLVMNEYTFHGSYAKLVRLLDSIHRTKKIGVIGSLAMKKPSDAPENYKKLSLQITFSGIKP